MNWIWRKKKKAEKPKESKPSSGSDSPPKPSVQKKTGGDSDEKRQQTKSQPNRSSHKSGSGTKEKRDHTQPKPRPRNQTPKNRQTESKSTAPEESAPQPAAEPLSPVSYKDLPTSLQEGVERAGWPSLMPVQSQSLPYMLNKRDVMVQSRTGSGKTGAFVLPLIELLDPGKKACQALILVPTRELARQVTLETQRILEGTDVNVVAVYGGVGYGEQISAFKKGVQVVVGTPGRILDHLLKRTLTANQLSVLIFDEADRLLSMGFYPDMREIKAYLPDRRNSYMFSATFPANVVHLAEEFLHKPELLSLSKDRVHVAETEHILYSVPGMDKDRALVRLIEVENPAFAIVFCNTRSNVHYVSVVLQRFGYNADELSADLSQQAREKVLGRLRSGHLRFLVATDVAARGIDIPELSHVILFDVPEDPESYIHRTGRTGRAGASGVAMTLATPAESLEMRRLEKKFGIEFVRTDIPSDEDVQDIVRQRMTAFLESEMRHRDKLQKERMQRFVPLVERLGEEEDMRQLIAMLIDDAYQNMQHQPPSVPRKQTPESHRPSRSHSRGNRRRRYSDRNKKPKS